jgi:hypothetical protein
MTVTLLSHTAQIGLMARSGGRRCVRFMGASLPALASSKRSYLLFAGGERTRCPTMAQRVRDDGLILGYRSRTLVHRQSGRIRPPGDPAATDRMSRTPYRA